MQRRILFAGPLGAGQTSAYRYHALERLGQALIPFDLGEYQYGWGKLNALRLRFPIGPLIARINAGLLKQVRAHSPEIVWLDKPIFYTPGTLRRIKSTGAQIVNYMQDNPFGPRNDGCWHQFLRVYPLFDLHCLVREWDIPQYRDRGLPYYKTQFSYDPCQHFPPHEGWSDADRTREVSYIGSPFEERPAFLRSLIVNHKLPVTISGPRWEKFLSPSEYQAWMSGGYLRDHEYREAIWRSKINLSFVTQLNLDDVAHRAFEITACGGFLLTRRTPGHQACFEEGKEAEFFSSEEECAEKIRYYLGHPEEREAIARRGLERARSSGYDNDSQLAGILARLEELRAAAPPA